MALSAAVAQRGPITIYATTLVHGLWIFLPSRRPEGICGGRASRNSADNVLSVVGRDLTATNTPLMKAAMKITTRQTSVSHEVYRWFLFTVCLGLVPLFLRWLLPTLFGPPLTFREVLSDGELLLIGAALAGAAVSDVLVGERGGPVRQTATFLAIICVLGSAVGYGAVKAGPQKNVLHVIIWSIVGFIASTIVGATGIVLKETAE